MNHGTQAHLMNARRLWAALTARPKASRPELMREIGISSTSAYYRVLRTLRDGYGVVAFEDGGPGADYGTVRVLVPFDAQGF